jgi:SnoaL-like domain
VDHVDSYDDRQVLATRRGAVGGGSLVTEDHASTEEVALRLRSVMESADLVAFGELLAPNVTWGPPGSPSPPCQSRRQVLAWYERSRDAGASAEVIEVEPRGSKILVGLVVSGTSGAEETGGRAQRWQVFSLNNGLIVDIVGFDHKGEAAEWAVGH